MPTMSTGGDSTSDPVILATAGYDHTIRFWQAHSGICYRTVQHPDSVSLIIAYLLKLLFSVEKTNTRGNKFNEVGVIAKSNLNPDVNLFISLTFSC